MKKTDVRSMSLIALMTALMCIFGPMSVPIGPVPVSLTVLTVYLAAYILGMKRGSLAYLLYLLLGLAGLPVLSGYSGGLGKLLGPTGGYLIGFLPMAMLSGYAVERFPSRLLLQLCGMLLGLFVCYGLGTVWLSVAAGISLGKAFTLGVLPFLAFDIGKLAIAVLVGRAVRQRMQQSLAFS
ncbi:biotin transporter BioY [Oribacterium sp. oral taxon 102]|uniref:biotin transporter BioY n=1 Tax=Oribacterium sp. oral taxon 102 TaxID=671214 RepID=UPI0015B9E4CA|nr:biotin transporter BioY [Oribacterium sp. oral taxon 102]NWO22286.1 biotin transporter BioY [Oribacterium sp. oral taxon 102]